MKPKITLFPSPARTRIALTTVLVLLFALTPLSYVITATLWIGDPFTPPHTREAAIGFQAGRLVVSWQRWGSGAPWPNMVSADAGLSYDGIERSPRWEYCNHGACGWFSLAFAFLPALLAPLVALSWRGALRCRRGVQLDACTCGYSMQGLAINMPCPECGVAVGHGSREHPATEHDPSNAGIFGGDER